MAKRELRYNPLLGQWVMVSSERALRPWRPSGKCPFCPGSGEVVFKGNVVVISNKYPVLTPDAAATEGGGGFFKKCPALGACYIVVETPRHDVSDLCELSHEEMCAVVKAWVELTRELSKGGRVNYVAIFRNRGEEVGVSLSHPHNQVYALPHVPLKVRVKLRNAREYYLRSRECLFCRILREELSEGTRVIYRNEGYAAFLPFYANWPFEVHAYSLRHVKLLTELTDSEVDYLADVLRAITGALNALFSRPMPYVMFIYQAPLKGEHEYFHLHIEFYPILRDRNKLKYAAGIELGTWDFTYDGVPEENARELRRACRMALEKHYINGPVLGSCS